MWSYRSYCYLNPFIKEIYTVYISYAVASNNHQLAPNLATKIIFFIQNIYNNIAINNVKVCYTVKA